MSAAIAWTDFLQNSGNFPASFTIPPRSPPMPSAQVLQVFGERIDFHIARKPPARNDFVSTYRIERKPPCAFIQRVYPMILQQLSSKCLPSRL